MLIDSIDTHAPEQFRGIASLPPLTTSEEPRPTLHFTIGQARCGKSTWARQFDAGLVLPDLPLLRRVVWNQDNLRLALTNRRYTRWLEPFVHAMKGYIIKALLLGGYHVLVDGTHTTEESVKQLLRVDIDATPILLDVPMAECQRRAVATNQEDLIPVIARHTAHIERIKAEGLDRFMERLRDEVRSHDEYRWGAS